MAIARTGASEAWEWALTENSSVARSELSCDRRASCRAEGGAQGQAQERPEDTFRVAMDLVERQVRRLVTQT
jgi:hypothetical protein